MVRALETGEFEELVDPRLEQNFDRNEMLLMIEAAAACVRHAASKRPRMLQVLFIEMILYFSEIINHIFCMRVMGIRCDGTSLYMGDRISLYTGDVVQFGWILSI